MQRNLLGDAGLVSKDFNGVEYQITLLDADEGWDVGMGVFKLLSVPIAKGYDSGAMDVQDYDFATNIALALSSTLDRVDVKSLMRSLLSSLHIDGTAVDFNKHFRGKYAHLISVTIWAFKENFSDFPDGFQVEGQGGVSEILTLFQRTQQSQTEENNEES
jgi:hypothetical protein